jgi:DNA-directed RNA polymerase
LTPKAEKPYGFLSCCVELFNYTIAQALGKPYYSGLPVGIDGSNNGWQHLAAMSKDKAAGSLVSLTNEAVQKDFYVAVAKNLVGKLPDWFASRGIPMKHIRKGIAKRGSMTRAYSAGKKRIASNMYDDLHMLGFNHKYNISEDDCEMLAGKLIDSINEVCQGPLKTTKYLQKMAEHELANGSNELSWKTPSGFPVVYKANLQHEHKQRGTIKGLPGSKTGRIMHVVKIDVVGKTTGEKIPCRRSFASGISPNVVHSYDAAHMANTIVAFNGSFAAVHDSFSCHASDVDLLQDITKMTFIAQYDVENFFDLLEDNLMEYKPSFSATQPVLGSLDINDVQNSQYFFC